MKPDINFLTASGLAAARLKYPAGSSPYFFVCDHASRRLPRALGSLGLAPMELKSHIAWDIGVAGLANRLAARLNACLMLQTYSRLVIDCNRPLGAPDSIAILSERTRIPGNEGLSRTETDLRAREIFIHIMTAFAANSMRADGKSESRCWWLCTVSRQRSWE